MVELVWLCCAAVDDKRQGLLCENRFCRWARSEKALWQALSCATACWVLVSEGSQEGLEVNIQQTARVPSCPSVVLSVVSYRERA